jgi:hypothetical protein
MGIEMRMPERGKRSVSQFQGILQKWWQVSKWFVGIGTTMGEWAHVTPHYCVMMNVLARATT